jgi:hypothetical protein
LSAEFVASYDAATRVATSGYEIIPQTAYLCRYQYNTSSYELGSSFPYDSLSARIIHEGS